MSPTRTTLLAAILASTTLVAANDTPKFTEFDVIGKFNLIASDATKDPELTKELQSRGIGFAWNDASKGDFKRAGISDAGIARLDKIFKDAIPKAEAGKSVFANVSLLSGAKLQNPYSISISTNAPKGSLKDGNTTTDGFLEIGLSTRYIFRTGVFDPLEAEAKQNSQGSPSSFKWLGFSRHDAADSQGQHRRIGFFPDYDLKIGYVFRGKNTPDKFEASTIAGGSDLYLDSSIGQPIFRFTTHQGFRAQGTLEAGGGFTTDKAFAAIHPTAFLGGGLQMSNLSSQGAVSPLGDTYFLLRAGYALVDQPKLDGTDVVLDQFRHPVFENKFAPSVGAAVIIKLNDIFSGQLSGNVYFLERASWNLSVGVYIDPSGFFKPAAKTGQ